MITHLLMAGVFAPPAQTVTVAGIGSTAAMGTPKIVSKIAPAGIGSTAAFGTAKTRFKIAPAGRASTVAFGTAKTVLKLAPTGRASTAAFGSPALSVGSPPAAPGLGVVSQTFVNRSGGYPLDTTVVADLTGAGGVLIFVSTASGVTWVPTVDVGGMAATYLGKSPDGASTGTVWAFSLLSPPTGSAINVRVLKADQYADQGVIAVLGMSGVQSYGFFDAKAGGSSITLVGTTTKTGGKIFSYAHGHFTSGALTLGASTPTGVEQIGADVVNGDHPAKLATLDYGSVGVDVSINWTVPFNQVNGCCVEVEGALVAPALILNPPSIVSTSAVGMLVVSRGNDKIIAPPGIHTTVMGSPTVIKQTLAIWDAGHKHADLTISGTPATVVEKTSSAATHSIVLATVPVVSGEKKYFEVTVNVLGTTTAAALGFTQNQSVALNVQLGAFGSSGIGWDATGNARQDNAGLASRLAWVAGDVLMFAIDMANGWVFFGKNGAWENAGNASQPINFVNGDGKANNTTLTTSNPAYAVFDGHIVGDKVTANFGRSAFAYTVPSGYSALDAAPVASPQTITAVGKASSTAFGAGKVNHTLHGAGIASTEAFGVATVAHGAVTLAPAGIEKTSALGSFVVQRGPVTVQMAGIASASALGSPVVSAGTRTVPMQGIASVGVLGAFSVVRGAVTVTMTGRASSVALGSPTILTAQAVVSPAGIPSSATLGASKVSHKLHGVGIASGAALGTAKIVSKVAVAGIAPTAMFGTPVLGTKVHVSGIASASSVGTPALTPGTVTVSMTGLKTGAVGTPLILTGTPFIVPEGIASTSRFGTHAVARGAVTLAPAGIAKTSAVGAPTIVSSGVSIRPQGIAKTSALGIADLSTGPVSVRPGSIVTGGMGTVVVKATNRLDTSGIDSTAAFGQLHILVGPVTLVAQGIEPASALGAPSIGRGGVRIEPASILPNSHIGQPEVIRQAILRLPGIGPTVAFGVAIVRTSGVQIEVPGIASGAVLGNPYIFVGVRPIGLPAYSFKVGRMDWQFTVAPGGPGGLFKVPTMQTFKFKVPRRAK